jgi:hypothetical protein
MSHKFKVGDSVKYSPGRLMRGGRELDETIREHVVDDALHALPIESHIAGEPSNHERSPLPLLALNGRADTHQTCPVLKVDRPCHRAAVTSQFDPTPTSAGSKSRSAAIFC